VLTEDTADLAVALMLMATRRLGEGERELRAGRWSGWHPMHHLGRRLSGKTLGIAGMGRIGRAVARRAVHGFVMRLHTRAGRSSPLARRGLDAACR
jgi:glyoxylate reductase